METERTVKQKKKPGTNQTDLQLFQMFRKFIDQKPKQPKEENTEGKIPKDENQNSKGNETYNT